MFALLLGGCATPEVVDPNQTVWRLEADKDRGTPVTLTKGEAKDAIVQEMGRPVRTDRNRNDRTVEVMMYERHIVGPETQRTANTAQGGILVRKHVFYVDYVNITMKDGALQSVSVTRRLEEFSNGVPIAF